MPWEMDDVGAGTVVAQEQLVTPYGVQHPLETRYGWVELLLKTKIRINWDLNQLLALAGSR